jgi:hypothetical protein
LEVTSEEVLDGKMLRKLVDNASSASEINHVKGILADGMYDSAKSSIKKRSNSKVRSTNCQARNMSVIRQQANLKRWKRRMNYAYRWMAETAFSSIKRMFGEDLTARKFPNMVKEIFLKATLYNMFNQMP